MMKLICGPSENVRYLWHMNWCISNASMMPISAIPCTKRR